ncbi:hypothetical protein GCM10009554_74920 [Kribbella koreensis]|uniref:Secreted protein n=1 Tax=Kribbella koreensis TaxID=57909 RepID=A0ABN1RMV5_9ACTN
MKIVRILAVVGLLAAGLFAGATPAAANGNYYLTSAISPFPSGWGSAEGSVDFTGKHKVFQQGYAQDHCAGDGSGDGYGVYVRSRVIWGNGAYSEWSPWQGDSSGCADHTEGFVSSGFSNPDRNILRMEVQLCLRDVQRNDVINCDLASFRNQYI